MYHVYRRSNPLNLLNFRLLVDSVGFRRVAVYDGLRDNLFAVFGVRQMPSECLDVRLSNNWMIEELHISDRPRIARECRKRTSGRVSQEHLVEDHSTEGRGYIRESRNGCIRSAARGTAPDGHNHEARTQVTSSVGGH